MTDEQVDRLYGRLRAFAQDKLRTVADHLGPTVGEKVAERAKATVYPDPVRHPNLEAVAGSIRGPVADAAKAQIERFYKVSDPVQDILKFAANPTATGRAAKAARAADRLHKLPAQDALDWIKGTWQRIVKVTKGGATVQAYELKEAKRYFRALKDVGDFARDPNRPGAREKFERARHFLGQNPVERFVKDKDAPKVLKGATDVVVQGTPLVLEALGLRGRKVYGGTKPKASSARRSPQVSVGDKRVDAQAKLEPQAGSKAGAPKRVADKGAEKQSPSAPAKPKRPTESAPKRADGGEDTAGRSGSEDGGRRSTPEPRRLSDKELYAARAEMKKIEANHKSRTDPYPPRHRELHDKVRHELKIRGREQAASMRSHREKAMKEWRERPLIIEDGLKASGPRGPRKSTKGGAHERKAESGSPKESPGSSDSGPATLRSPEWKGSTKPRGTPSPSPSHVDGPKTRRGAGPGGKDPQTLNGLAPHSDAPKTLRSPEAKLRGESGRTQIGDRKVDRRTDTQQPPAEPTRGVENKVTPRQSSSAPKTDGPKTRRGAGPHDHTLTKRGLGTDAGSAPGGPGKPPSDRRGPQAAKSESGASPDPEAPTERAPKPGGAERRVSRLATTISPREKTGRAASNVERGPGPTGAEGNVGAGAGPGRLPRVGTKRFDEHVGIALDGPLQLGRPLTKEIRTVKRIVDRIERRAIKRAAEDPEFLKHFESGNITDAGTRFHTIAKEEARKVGRGKLPRGYEVSGEVTIKDKEGKVSRLDVPIRSPSGVHVVDWKTTGKSGLDKKGQAAQHAKAVADSGETLLSHETRSWRAGVTGEIAKLKKKAGGTENVAPTERATGAPTNDRNAPQSGGKTDNKDAVDRAYRRKGSTQRMDHSTPKQIRKVEKTPDPPKPEHRTRRIHRRQR